MRSIRSRVPHAATQATMNDHARQVSHLNAWSAKLNPGSHATHMSRITLHAEAFHFRRMTVARLDGQDTYRFFYASNRTAADAGGSSLLERMGSRRDSALTLGSFDTTISPTLGVGMLINPTTWFQNEEINLQAVEQLDQAVFLARLRGRIQASPRESLLIVVHGYKEVFETALPLFSLSGCHTHTHTRALHLSPCSFFFCFSPLCYLHHRLA